MQIAEAIKSPDTCDICWGTEGVKKKVPVFWVEGLGLQSEGENKVTCSLSLAGLLCCVVAFCGYEYR